MGFTMICHARYFPNGLEKPKILNKEGIHKAIKSCKKQFDNEYGTYNGEWDLWSDSCLNGKPRKFRSTFLTIKGKKRNKFEETGIKNSPEVK